MLRHPLLEACGVAHGFGVRGAAGPDGLLRPAQVHGNVVVSAEACRAQPRPAADAVVSEEPGVAVGVVTADCVPILMATRSGRVVAAIHAGWRGLAAGIVAAGVEAVCARADCETLVAVVGPHIGICCYEVDAPVLEALAERFGAALRGVARPARSGHVLLDLGALALWELRSRAPGRIEAARTEAMCTQCDPARFHSYRRDGARAGRLVHFVAAREA
jgi:purine-nucleoside/S-methyl-5'-thioadenosine phosphorylase / adenosine deaminase